MSEKPYIIVVDDVIYNLEVIEMCLIDVCADFDFVSSGKEALALIKKRTPALILLDIIMPEMDGIEVCKHIKNNPETKDITVVFLSALDAVEEKVKAFEAGGVDYITKPFNVLDVVARVNTHLKLHNMHEEMNTLLKNSFHEIYTPLSMIKSSLSLQEIEYGETEHIKNMKAAAQSLHSIYEDIYYAIKKEIRHYPVQWNELEVVLQERAKLFKHHMKLKGLSYNISSEIESPMIKINLTELERIIDNLLSNAVKYAIQNTQITILVKPDGDKINVCFKNVSNKIKNVKEVFKELYQDNKNNVGMGIGLNIVKNICDKYDIDISVDSNENSTYFTLKYKEQ
jgi:CheY-like chemotaxis protein